MANETIPDPEITYNKFDQQIWDEDLDDFVPELIFDAHTHLWADEHLPADDPGIGKMMTCDMDKMVTWNKQIFPNRRIEYIVLGTPRVGMDVPGHNRWVHEQMQPYRNSRIHAMVTPAITPDQIRAEVETYGFTGLKPYRTFSVTGDINQCRIHEFLTHEQMEVANDLGLWVTMHLSRYHGCADEYNLKDLEEYTNRRYPKIKWLLAHCARAFTYWPLPKAIERLRDMPNIWYDGSAVCDVMPHYTLFKQEDHRRILFGTDNLVANTFHGHYAAMGRFWYQIETPEYAKQENIHCDHRPILSIYEQLLCMKHAAELAELTPSQINDIFYNNAKVALGLED
jgi:predicted TIM-barrel fold metal-dependent hydrolase